MGGTALILGSLLLTVYSIAFPALLPASEAAHDITKLVLNPHWLWIPPVAFLGVTLMMFGFAAVYSRLYAGAGLVGLLGFIFIEIAYLLQACKVTWEICLYPAIAANAGASALLRDELLKHSPQVTVFRMVAGIAILLGIVLFCSALLRSRAFPRVAGLLIFLGAFIYALGPVLTLMIAIAGIFTLSMGCLVLGVSLMRPDRTAPAVCQGTP